MTTTRRVFSVVMVVVLTGWTSDTFAAPAPQTAKGQLTVTGRVLMPDGSPAAGAIVSSLERNGAEPNTTKTGPDGGFQLSGQSWYDCRLHARSVDETQQATLFIPANLARTQLVKPVEMKLTPAREYVISVRSGDNPVDAAQVLVEGGTYKILKTTNADGFAQFWIPTDEKLRSVAAWHPKLGAAGKMNHDGLPGETTQLTLLPPKSHIVRVIANDGQPVPDLKLGVSVGVSGSNGATDWIVTEEVEKAQGRTDERGELKLSWIPDENLKYLNPEVIDTAWKVDEIERDKVSEGITTLRVRRMVVVSGQLKMPGGASAEGILVGGFGFGSGSRGAVPLARAASDGSFSFAAASDHGYALRICDSEWASDDWSGMILATENAKPAAISLEAYASTPLDVRVTRGPQHDPVPKAWVSVGCERPFSWTDAQGQKRYATANMSYWLLTDAEGATRAGTGKGKHKVSLSFGKWQEERVIENQDVEKKTIAFYRSWLKSRTITGRLLLNQAPQNAFPTTVIRAEARDNRSVAILPEIRPDGSFKLEADASDVKVFVLDAAERWSGFATVPATANTLDLALSSTAVFSGTVVDEKGKPLPGVSLQMALEGTRFAAAKNQVTDEKGNFQFGAVAANVPVRLQIRPKGDGDKVQFNRTRFFLPGEVREKTRVVITSRVPTDLISLEVEAPALALPLAERVNNVIGNARLGGMRALMVLQGDSSDEVKKLTAAILDFEDLPEVLGFLPLEFSAKAVKSDAATIKQFDWHLPEKGEVVLIALDGGTKSIATQRIADADSPTAIKLATAFVKQHAPAPRDAKVRLAAAQEAAKATGRRVWVVQGGPRCGPCFKLARWMEEHHALLEKDYVLLKVSEMDKSIGEVMKLLDQPEGKGIPWMAIVEPDGPVMATSDGPLGNIGFPGTIEDIRHLREMLQRTARKLTAIEQDQLAESLAQPEL
ncbi:MAG: thioredoxin family protein [Pirellulaceae bacterium]|nr:thioredoxin family protein [Pirellulaceae bacterium]